MIGLFGCTSSAHSVKRLRRTESQPGFDGRPIPERALFAAAGRIDGALLGVRLQSIVVKAWQAPKNSNAITACIINNV